MIPSPEIRKVTAGDYIRLVKNNIRILFFAMAVSVPLALILLIMPKLPGPDVYEASATILIEEPPELIGGQAHARSGILRDVNVVLERMESFSFAERVADKLGRKDAQRIQSMVKIDPPEARRSNMLTIRAKSRDPEETAAVVNAYVDTIVEVDIETKREFTEYGAEWLQTGREGIGAKLREAELKLQEFSARHKDVEMKAKALETLQAEKEKSEREIQQLLLRYKEQHPSIVSLRRHIDIVDEQVEEIMGDDDPKGVYERILQYNMLEQQLKTLREVHSRFAEASEEAAITKGLVMRSVQIVRKAHIPTRPAKRRPTTGIAIRIFILGIALGLGAIYVKEWMDTTIKLPEEVEFYAKLPFLGSMPQIGSPGLSRSLRDVFCNYAADSEFSEAVRNIKVSMLFAAPDQTSFKTVLVVSAKENEGRTTLASNLAIIFARGGQKTLLIDGNMRDGDLAKSYSKAAGKGLSDLFAGECSVDEIVTPTEIDNLSVIGAGTRKRNAADLLLRCGCHDLLNAVKERFDHIIVDGVRQEGYVDNNVIAKECDAVLLVIRAGRTPLASITESAKKLAETGTPVVGAVLNNF